MAASLASARTEKAGKDAPRGRGPSLPSRLPTTTGCAWHAQVCPPGAVCPRAVLVRNVGVKEEDRNRGEGRGAKGRQWGWTWEHLPSGSQPSHCRDPVMQFLMVWGPPIPLLPMEQN